MIQIIQIQNDQSSNGVFAYSTYHYIFNQNETDQDEKVCLNFEIYYLLIKFNIIDD